MPHIVQCSCGWQLTLEQWHEGMKVRCPSCQTVLACDPRREPAADILASATQTNVGNDDAAREGLPAWLLAAGLAIGLVLLAIYLFVTPGRFLTGLALLLTGVPLTLTGLYLQFQSLFDYAADCDLEPSLARRASKLLFLAGLVMSAGGFVALFGK